MALQITEENYDEVLGSDKPILLDFWAEWCGPCKLIGPIIDEISEDFSDTAVVGKINVDEAGNLSSKHGIRNITEFFRAFFREFLLLMLLVPYLRFISILLILIYSFYYTKNVYSSESNNPRIFILPFINISLLFISFFYSIKGFATGKQKL